MRAKNMREIQNLMRASRNPVSENRVKTSKSKNTFRSQTRGDPEYKKNENLSRQTETLILKKWLEKGLRQGQRTSLLK